MPGAQQPEFSLVTSFTQQGRPNMAAYMATGSDPASPGYGTIRLLVLPQNTASGAASPAVRSAIAQAERSFAAAQTALKNGNFTAYGQDLAAVKKALDAAQQAARKK